LLFIRAYLYASAALTASALAATSFISLTAAFFSSSSASFSSYYSFLVLNDPLF